MTDTDMLENFDFLAFAQGREYPTDEVTLYFDEAAAYKLQSEDDPEKIVTLKESLRNSAVTLRLTGIPIALSDRIMDIAVEKFPRKYRTERNFMTGVTEKIELTAADDNQEAKARDRFYTNLFYAAHITGMVRGGAVDTTPITFESVEDEEYVKLAIAKVDVLRRTAPPGQLIKFYKAVKALTVEAEAYENVITEDF